jgi:hypothetical protein
VHFSGKLKGETPGSEAKASLNRAIKSLGCDAKPGELRMGRVKVA